MKTRKDPRHIERINTIQELFAWEFSKENPIELDSVSQIVKNLDEIDKYVEKSAPKWGVEKINRMDLAILRLAVYELMIKKDNPPKVVVDEAVEIAKEYGSDSSSSFINGALGKLIEDQKIPT
ncbi:MAG: hypothetical protein ACD_30C00112G0052 [uncultured bacterium]|uniref:Transcription antitermination protein NusB n=4 Tax=Candidatus Daviesiibacteriota TaxID=1752718 RepID=A0A0G0EUD2_9BACT|nr:MAG: hypothetical protein ACD_30C00112G0052 [uncultured bacterium]KKQ10528.1 MAG: N utilization substance protein B-like protein [Candidatus Daviesbacteria bacterium GW2011_GWB1_36_5]KKQ15272.1 MAG: N utilization substance protein B-like protein [Candidatus Daviesbacteria bacterium GW2011_GWA1_36_8]OGE17211.1 MAG: transcription antitermination factor NusB [Candidatus Daviesbacteria bacterium RIFCSPHIGHO2_01_FULL_36_37]OGE35992.1 MAG: transcription antitermination factor NusB [Candidatus Davi